MGCLLTIHALSFLEKIMKISECVECFEQDGGDHGSRESAAGRRGYFDHDGLRVNESVPETRSVYAA